MTDEGLELTAIVGRMASARPTPAGGAAAAVAIAHGAALLSKAVRIGRRDDATATSLAHRLESLAHDAASGFSRDCAAFEAVLTARRASDPRQRRAAWSQATRVPLDLATIAIDALTEAPAAGACAPRSMEADVDAASRLLETGLAISLDNARANVVFVDGSERDALQDALAAATESAAQIARAPTPLDRHAREVASATKQACVRAAAEAALDGGYAGLCVEGRLELVVDAVRAVTTAPIVSMDAPMTSRSGEEGGAPAD